MFVCFNDRRKCLVNNHLQLIGLILGELSSRDSISLLSNLGYQVQGLISTHTRLSSIYKINVLIPKLDIPRVA